MAVNLMDSRLVSPELIVIEDSDTFSSWSDSPVPIKVSLDTSKCYPMKKRAYAATSMDAVTSNKFECMEACSNTQTVEISTSGITFECMC